MYALDFEYDGRYLSDYGFIICDFQASSGTNISSAGSKITFNTVSRHNGKKHGLVSAKYEECIQSTFDICKNPDVHDDLEITNDELRDLMRWLNRSEFLKFHVLHEDPNIEKCYYEASFNVDKIKIGEKLYGLSLTMETNKPFGYGFEKSFTYDVATENDVFQFIDVSDEIGFTYPSLVITCKANCDLSIKNNTYDSVIVINNCKIGEVINIDGDTMIITSSYPTHDICNDFNYEFLKIGNTMDYKINEISVSHPCKLEIRYTPIIKDSP